MEDRRKLGSYELEERLAVGGMAEVYRARRRGPGGFNKLVAVKRLLPDLNRDPDFVAMFLEEARLQSRLSSPNLIEVFDFGEIDGEHYLAMELVDGIDLAALHRAVGALPIELAHFIALEVCRALEALHQASGPEGPLHVIHRDVTPGNVLVSARGEVKLGDFGIAKARARALRTERGTIKGTLAYLSPEQARGDEVDERSDLYGLGLVLFELATGERFLSSPTERTLLAAAERPLWRAPSSLRPEASLFDAVLARALAVEPVRRFASAQQFRSALEALPLAGGASPRLAELVASVRDSALAPRRPLAAAGKLPTRREVDVPRPRVPTERLQARSRRSVAWPLLVAALAVAASVSLWAWWPTVAVRPRAGLDSVRVDADAAPPPAPPAPPQPAMQPAAPVPVPALARPLPRPRPRASGYAPSTEVMSLTEVPLPPPSRFETQLADLDRLLTARGLRPEDAVDLFTERRELGISAASGTASAEQVAALRQRVEVFVIDRPFVERKLRRLQVAVEAGRLTESAQRELLPRSQAALSDLVNGRYLKANEQLNAIASTLEGAPATHD